MEFVGYRRNRIQQSFEALDVQHHTVAMARMSTHGGASKSFAWTTIFYLLLVFIAPMALLGTVRAEDEQAPLQENYGTVIGIDLGTTYSYVYLLVILRSIVDEICG